MGNHWPAVIATRTQDVEFVTALRPMLMRPQLARARMNGSTLHIAIAVGEDLRHRPLALGERIVRGTGTGFGQPQDGA